jgi:protein TonB
MKLVTFPLKKAAVATARRHPGAAVAISLGIHGFAAGFCAISPLRLPEWSNATRAGPVRVTWAVETESARPVSESEPVLEKPRKRAELVRKPRPAASLAVCEPRDEPEPLPLPQPGVEERQLAFVTVSEVFEPSLEFPEKEEEVSAEIESRPPAPRAKPAAFSGSLPPGGPSTGKVTDARPVRTPSPAYPPVARSRGYQGTAIFLLSIGSNGSVEAVSLSKSSGFSILDSNAASALRRWKFAPAKRGGIAVASRVRVPISFRLE